MDIPQTAPTVSTEPALHNDEVPLPFPDEVEVDDASKCPTAPADPVDQNGSCAPTDIQNLSRHDSNQTDTPGGTSKDTNPTQRASEEDVDMEDDNDNDNESMEEDADGPTFSDEAVKFLESCLPDYLALGSKKARRGFWQLVSPEFLKLFPEQLVLEERVKVKRVKEKSEAELSAMSNKAMRAFKARLKRSKYEPKQRLLGRIKNWYWWRLGRKKGDKKPFQPLFDDMKRGRKAPRRRQLAHIVMDEFSEEVKARSKETSTRNQLQCRTSAARDLLKTMEPQVVQALMQRREDEFEAAMRLYKGQQATEEEGDEEGGDDEAEMRTESSSKDHEGNGGSKASPASGWSKMTVEQRAEMLRCREGFIPIVQPFLDGLRDLTGYSMVLLAGVCTDPKEKRFTQATVHSKPDNMPDFAEHSGDKFKEFGKLFWRWVRDIKVATDAEPENTGTESARTESADKPDGIGSRTETENSDQLTQAQGQPQPPASTVDKAVRKRTKGKNSDGQKGVEATGGGRKKGHRRKRKGKGKGKKGADVWDSDRAEMSSDDEVEGLQAVQDPESVRPRPQPIRRSGRIQAHENSKSLANEGEPAPTPTTEHLPEAPRNLPALHHPKVYSLALRYVYDDIKTIGDLENKLEELLGDQYSWDALSPLFDAVMAGEDGNESCADAVRALETKHLFLQDVQPLYHPEVYRLARMFMDSETMTPEDLDMMFREVLGERYVSQEMVAPLLDKMIAMEEAGEDGKEGVAEMEEVYLERLHRLVASKVASQGEQGGVGDPTSPGAEDGTFPTDVKSRREGVFIHNPPPPAHASTFTGEDDLQPELLLRSPLSKSGSPALLEDEKTRSSTPGSHASTSSEQEKTMPQSQQAVSRDSPLPPLPDEDQTAPTSGPSPAPNTTTSLASLPSSSEYKTFVDVISTIHVEDLPSFVRFSADGVSDRFIRGHMHYLLEVGKEKPTCWECLVYKWVDVESIWTSRDLKDQEVSKEGRPESLSWWFGYGRLRTERTPNGVTAEGMETVWWSWWTKANPDWREKVDGKVVPGGSGPWDQLRAPGPNGVVLFLVALRWWHDRVQNETQMHRWELAVKCVFDTLCALHQDALICTAPQNEGQKRRRPAGALAPEDDAGPTQKRRRTRR
ncbi:SERTA domain-containing protein 3 [Marasmius crinis-equi]|uniref:SERTA domain-containing protein 3 n=1 Tax=Marasmius crinis-equi TaxID=585013 RepID=A0ABR3F097_9AGAR